MNDSLKILVVEDDEDTRGPLVFLLRKRGYNVLEASKGSEALDIMGKEKPDIVFLDIQLADNMNGIEVLRKTREVSLETKVIIMSAYREEYMQQTEELGAYSFLKKPILKIDQLTNLIEEIRKKKNLS